MQAKFRPAMITVARGVTMVAQFINRVGFF
jgi:hypothetical protein